MSQGQGPGLTSRVIGETSGTETVLLLSANMPIHNHMLQASTQNVNSVTIGNTVLPGNVATAPTHLYVLNTGSPAPTYGNLNPSSVSVAGGGQPHNNMMPSLCVSFIISLYGIFPSRN